MIAVGVVAVVVWRVDWILVEAGEWGWMLVCGGVGIGDYELVLFPPLS